MAVPKFKKSRANTRARRSQWKADNVELQTQKINGQEVQIPRRRWLRCVPERPRSAGM